MSQSGSLPAAFRDQFVAAFSSVASSGFQIGTGENGAQLPAGIPPAVAHQLTVLAHDVFVSAFIDAMKPTLAVPIAFLFFTAATTIFIKRKQPPAQQQPVQREELRAVAG